MDQEKIGKFIAELRKGKGLTQAKLAEALGITDRAVSKWENGRSMPNVGVMLKLCELLGITVNELLSGERITMEKYPVAAEENLLKLQRESQADKRCLLNMEIVIGVLGVTAYIALMMASTQIENAVWQAALIAVAVILLIISLIFALKIEREVGLYECRHCGHGYVPGRMAFMWSAHMGRTRYLKCPNCGRYSWQKKVVR